MNINFQAITGRGKDEGLDILGMEPKETFASKAGGSRSAITEPVSIQLDSSIFSNNAYACQAKNADNIRRCKYIKSKLSFFYHLADFVFNI